MKLHDLKLLAQRLGFDTIMDRMTADTNLQALAQAYADSAAQGAASAVSPLPTDLANVNALIQPDLTVIYPLVTPPVVTLIADLTAITALNVLPPLGVSEGQVIYYLFTQGATPRTLVWDATFHKDADAAAVANRHGVIGFVVLAGELWQITPALAWRA